MTISVQTHDFEFAKELAQSAPAGVSASIERRGAKSFGTEYYGLVIVTLEFVRKAANAVIPNLFAAWLCAKCKDRPCTIDYRGEVIPKDQEAIRRLVEEVIEIGKND